MKTSRFGFLNTALLIILSLVLMISLIACGNSSKGDGTNSPDAPKQSSEPSDEPVTITLWTGFTGSDRAVLEELFNEYNESQNEVKVVMEIMDWEILYQKLTAVASTDEGPDFIIFGPENIANYVNIGLIAPIDDFYEQNRIDRSLFPALFEQLIKYDDHYIGIPMNFFAMSLYYNIDLVEAAGLDPEKPPTNWDELADWAVKLTDSSKGQYGLNIQTNVTSVQYMWQNGGDILDYETKTATINQPEAVEAVKYLADLYINKQAALVAGAGGAEGAMPGQLFTAGKLGMLIDGPWQSPQLKEAGLNYGLAPVPAGPVQQANFGAGLSFHLTNKGIKDEDKKEAFYQFTTWWFQKDIQRKWSSQVGFAPIRTDMADDAELIAANPDLEVFMAASNAARPYLLGIKNSQKIESDIVKRYLDEILLNGADVQTTLDKAATDLDAILSTER